jgi:hypothetical protein
MSKSASVHVVAWTLSYFVIGRIHTVIARSDSTVYAMWPMMAYRAVSMVRRA